MFVGASLNNLYGLGLLCVASAFRRASLGTHYGVNVVAFHYSHPTFVVEAAHVQYKPQVVCNEHGPIQ